MKIAIGCDHGGFHLKEKIKEYLSAREIEVKDKGTYSEERVDFPLYAEKVAEAVAGKEADLGILCCGTGIGMSIAANKVKGIRAAVVGDCFSAKATREHNDSNILCLGERVTEEALALKILDEWLNAEFEGDRHIERLNQLADIENKNFKK